jgi:hypothetical protein
VRVACCVRRNRRPTAPCRRVLGRAARRYNVNASCQATVCRHALARCGWSSFGLQRNALPGVELEHQRAVEWRVEYDRAVYNAAGPERIAEEEVAGARRAECGKPWLGVAVLSPAVN